MTLCSNVASSDLIQGMLDRDAEPLRVTLSPVPVADVLTVRFAERRPMAHASPWWTPPGAP